MTAIKHIDQRVAVLIDAHNLYHTSQNLYGRNVKFEALMEEAIDGRQVVRAIAYVATSGEGEGEENNFFDALTKAGIEVKSKEVQVFPDGKKKADWDVGITVDAIKFAPKVDAIILMSGDGDFAPMVTYVQHHAGVQVEVVAFSQTTSYKLKEVIDDFTDISSNTRKYLLPKKRGSGARRTPRNIAGNSRRSEPEIATKSATVEEKKTTPTRRRTTKKSSPKSEKKTTQKSAQEVEKKPEPKTENSSEKPTKKKPTRRGRRGGRGRNKKPKTE